MYIIKKGDGVDDNDSWKEEDGLIICEVVSLNFKVILFSAPQMRVLTQVICYSGNQWALELELKSQLYKLSLLLNNEQFRQPQGMLWQSACKKQCRSGSLKQPSSFCHHRLVAFSGSIS